MYMFAIGLLATVALAQMRPAQIVVLVGPPGSGKSVQAKRLSRTLKVPAISIESVVKDEIGRRTQTAISLAGAINSGELVGDDGANEIMMPRLLQADATKGFILDGYPVTEKQAAALDAFLKEQDFPKPVVVILEAPDAILRQRMKSRRRAGDTTENIDRRIREYRQMESFAERRYGAVRVDGSGDQATVAAAVVRGIEAARQKRGLSVRPPV